MRFFWILCAWMSFAGSGTLGQPAPRSPAVVAETPNLALPTAASDVCAIDFRNAQVFDATGKYIVKLSNGTYRHQAKHSTGHEWVKLTGVGCIVDGHSKRAIIMLEWLTCGGSCSSDGVVQVLELRAGHPVISQQLSYNSQADGSGATFDSRSVVLKITGRSDDDTPNCCPRTLDVVSFRWVSNRFVLDKFEQVPVRADPGKIHGKITAP